MAKLGLKISIVALTLNLVGAFALSADLNKAPKQDLPNFQTVIEGQIYRGGQPSPAGLQKLAAMGIKTIIDLRIEAPREEYQEWKLGAALGMRVIPVPMSPINDPISSEIAYVENGLLTDPSLRPIFVHCMAGEDRTGLVIGLYRVFDQQPGWTPAHAYAEMVHYGFHTYLKELSEFFFKRTGWRP